MDQIRRRRFTLIDVIILVAATAVGFALIRSAGLRIDDPGRERYLAAYMTASVSDFLLPLLTAWTVAYLVLVLIEPRPTWRTLIRRPGMLACCAGVAALAYRAAWVSLIAMRWGIQKAWLKGYLPSERLCWLLSRDVPPWIAGVWLGAVLMRQWRPEPTWIDRLGRAIGVAWILEDVAKNLTILLLP